METPTPITEEPLKLYAAWYCPFAQRAWMGLLYKGLTFEYIEVDPYEKSPWWLNLSRNRDKVPVIVTPAGSSAASTTVIDSTRILEYLEDLEPEINPLFPSDPDDKAELRFWIDHINQQIVPYVYRYLEAEQPGEYRDNSRAALLEGVRELSDAMSLSGPFFSGRAPTAIDLLLIPFTYRIDALLGHYRHFSFPTTGATWSCYRRWYASMCATDIFHTTSIAHADYRTRLIEFYLPYSQGRGQQDVMRVP